jgi:uncharacterized membrane protein (DUF2068 family)
MVNITECVACGRVIPATDEGCAYCERERPVEMEGPYLPLSIRLLLILFGLNAAATAVFGVLGLARLIGPDEIAGWAAAPALIRTSLAACAFVGLIKSQCWGWYAALGFVAVELIGGLLAIFEIIPQPAWAGPMLAPLWTVLFVFMLVRSDVHARFDQRVADRRDVSSLLESVHVDKGS